MRPNVDDVTIAYEKARAREAVASNLRVSLMHTAIHDMHEAGTSVREIATRLHVPKSTVWRHLRGMYSVEPPVWGDESEYLRANRDVWAHAPDAPDADLDWCPWEWQDTVDGRIVGYRTRDDAEAAVPSVKLTVGWAGELDHLNRLNRLAGEDPERRFMTAVSYLVLSEVRYPGQLPEGARWHIASEDLLKDDDGHVQPAAIDKARQIADDWADVSVPDTATRQALQWAIALLDDGA